MNIEVESYGLLSKNKGKKTIQAGKERPICSSCGEALKKGSTTCDVCGTVQGGAASRLSDSELESKLRSARLVSLLYMLAAPVLVIVGFAAALALLSPVTVVCLIAAVICFIIGLSYRGRMKRLVSANIVRDALSEVFEECSYSHNEHIPGTDVSEAALIPKWDEIYGSDLVEGKYKGRGIRFSDVKLIEVKERIKINGKNRDKRVIVFKGQWLVCDLGRELPSQLRVSEKAFSLFKGKSDVETESTAFNEKFRIQTDNSHTAFYILTPHFMEFILAADAKADARVFLSFTEVINLRRGMSVGELNQAAGQMDAMASRLNVVAENYPQLRSSDVFVQLQSGIRDAEEHLQAARRLYNSNVTSLNTAIEVFPSSIVARAKNVQKREFFVAEEHKKSDVAMKF